MLKTPFLPALFLSFIASVSLWAQTGSDTKAKQLEEMRKLKQQMMEEQKTIQQQSEWNNQSSQQEIKKLNQENQQKNFEIATTRQEAQKARTEAARAKTELEIKMRELAETQTKIDSAKKLLGETEELLMTSEMRNKRIAERLQFQEDSVKILKKEQEVQELQLKASELELGAQKAKNNLYIIVAAISLSLLSIIGILFVGRQKTLRELEEKNRIIQEEKRRSDELLLNILPEEVMHELKAHGKTTAKNYAKATVLFADIKDFTGISERLTPDELIEGLDAYFERFDKVIEKYDIEKIKTIGDAYVCAGGVPTKSEGNPHLVVQAALDFMREIDTLRRERTAQGKIPFEFRIGIHTGQLVAGVIGIRKFAYDIWGDTVNMAARMQQAGEIGKINISGATYEMVKDKFACVYRGKIEAKNKGEIDMYFVEKTIA
ncbi:MAG TPA: adenylate/guanylate cyclase domain-containing protein [Chitinophagales bacterium]|nr:adenylate/guanylate cyclase domain-containing protein [Chitinophagales bacterium]